MNSLHSLSTPMMKALRPAVEALARVHRHRDPQTNHHESRVAHLAAALAARMGLPASRIEILYMAALLHDIGNVGIPSELIHKTDNLSDPETLIRQTHCVIGHDILLQLHSPFPIAEIVHQHHERLDGSGFPRRLRGDAILKEAQILAVADTFDAMSTYRQYRAPLAQDFVLEELKRQAGTALNKDAVEACVRHVLGGAAELKRPAAPASTPA